MADATRRVSVRLSLDDAARVKQELREVGETGQRSLARIQGGAERASRALDLLDVAVRGVQIAGLAAGLRAVVVAGDALTQSMGRLNTALGSVERAGEIYDRLYQDSLQTGVAVRESVDAFARFSIAAREIGATSDQVATLVGGLQRIAIASGASQQEISSATQQLAQALASGTLQGDELRSILEGLPTLAQALARELGVSIGELRKLGSEGKLTADTVFPALLGAVEKLNGEFERAPLSVGRAFGQLTVATDQFLARLDQAIGLTATARGLLLNSNRGIGFVVQTTHAKEFALAHWLVGGADGGRLCLRCFDGAGIVRESIAGDALASGTTLQWAPTSKTWQAGAVMQESDLNRRQTVRFGPEVAFAQIGIIGFDGQIELEALRLYGLPEDAPAILSGCPALPAGGRTLMFSASWDLPSMPPGTTTNADVTVPGARRGDFADASLDTSSIAVVLDCHVWSNDKVRVTARNVSLSTVDLPAAALHVQVVKRRVG